ncbi:NUDIX domain-containing protein [Streptomyces smyrnaeus]|uniref:NUDIX domain-containing protein n=1 Tax=Streptomyces smyrnaeus TaxID=1387713 RepID=UPI00368A7D67
MHGDHDNRRPGQRRIGGLLLLRNQAGDPLLVKPGYRAAWWSWQLVGGGARPGETADQAALREGVEETGLTDLTVGPLLVVDYIPANPASGAAEGYNFVYDGGVLPNGTTINLPPATEGQPRELTDWAFITRQQLSDYCNDIQGRRIAQALDVLAHPTHQRFLREGQPV